MRPCMCSHLMPRRCYNGRQQTAGSRQQAAGSRQQAAGSRQQAADCRQQGTGSRQRTGPELEGFVLHEGVGRLEVQHTPNIRYEALKSVLGKCCESVISMSSVSYTCFMLYFMRGLGVLKSSMRLTSATKPLTL
jgi:hypothetical protein